jgi:hypothetical protein
VSAMAAILLSRCVARGASPRSVTDGAAARLAQ